MRIYHGDKFADAYEAILTDVMLNPEYETAPRRQKIKEITNACLTFNPTFPLYENGIRGSKFKYIAAELVWYFNGDNDIEFISKFANFWKYLDNGDGKANSAYGNLLFVERTPSGFSQWRWALESLINDKDTRQAILHFNLPKHQYSGNLDFVCTLNGVFQIRDNHLNFTINMRSNDLILGLPTDVAFFCLLQQQMLSHLKEVYPDLKMGTYTHFINSAHVYEKHFDLVTNMLNAKYTNEPYNPAFIPLSFPPLGENLIRKNGNPTPDMKQLHLDIIIGENDHSKIFSDPLYKWISDLTT